MSYVSGETLAVRNGWEVVRSRAWVRDDGRKASIFGAHPATSDAEAKRWRIEAQGFTVRNPNTGEVGACRQPFATLEGAIGFAEGLGRPSRIGIGD